MDYYHIVLFIFEFVFFVAIMLISFKKISRDQFKKILMVLIVLTIFTPFLKLLD